MCWTLPGIRYIGVLATGYNVVDVFQSLGMRVLACDPIRHKNLECQTMQYAGLDELLEESDIVVLHCPLLPKDARHHQPPEHRQNEGWGYYYK